MLRWLVRRQFSKFFTKNHEWIEISTEPNKNSLLTAKVGISEYSQKALGDVVYVELPSVEQSVNPMGK